MQGARLCLMRLLALRTFYQLGSRQLVRRAVAVAELLGEASVPVGRRGGRRSEHLHARGEASGDAR